LVGLPSGRFVLRVVNGRPGDPEAPLISGDPRQEALSLVAGSAAGQR